MSDVSPEIHELAERVIAREAHASLDGDELALRLERTFSRLQEVTANVIGDLGYLALMSRALRTTRATFPWLPHASSEPGIDFPRSRWNVLVVGVGADASASCAKAILANVLGLIASFIGEDFIFRLARRAWPDERGSADSSEAGDT